MQFGERLKFLREKNNLTQKELAVKLNITDSMICMYEANKKSASVSTLISMARFFHVSLDYLLGLENEQKDIFSEHIYDIARDIMGLEEKKRVLLIALLDVLKKP